MNDLVEWARKRWPSARVGSSDPAFKQRIIHAHEDVENSDMSADEKQAAHQKLAEEYLAHIKPRMRRSDN
ncbi:MAG: hypothetical protein ACLP4V_18675 [Methylocella sp.]